MKLEDYFDFLAPDDIRIKGSRIGIESILYEYIHRAQTPEKIVERFPSLSLEQVYATILYYLHDKETVSDYLSDYLDYCRQTQEDYEKNLPPVVVRLRQLKAEREAARMAGEESGTVRLVEQP